MHKSSFESYVVLNALINTNTKYLYFSKIKIELHKYYVYIVGSSTVTGSGFNPSGVLHTELTQLCEENFSSEL